METTGHVRGYLKTCQREHSREHVGGGGKGPWDDGGYQNKRRGKKMVFKKCKGAYPEFWRKMWTIIQQNVTLKMPSYAEGWGVGMLNFWVTKRVPQKILKKAGMGHLSISNRGQFLISLPPPNPKLFFECSIKEVNIPTKRTKHKWKTKIWLRSSQICSVCSVGTNRLLRCKSGLCIDGIFATGNFARFFCLLFSRGKYTWS